MHCLWSPKCAILHELLPGSCPVQPDELAAPQYVPEIAAMLCRFHGIPAPVSGVACMTAASVSAPVSSILERFLVWLPTPPHAGEGASADTVSPYL